MEKINRITPAVKKELKQREQSRTSLPKLNKRSADLVKRVPTGELFLTQFNPDYCSNRYQDFKTSELALKTGLVKLREIAQAYHSNTPVIMLKLWLVNLSKFMDFDITDQQARETGQYIYEEVNMFNLAEITLLFKRIKKGFYGAFYGKFNGQIILKACREYRKERGNILSGLSTDEQLKLI